MEKWEQELRAKLNKELKDGAYYIQNNSKAKIMTGKQGKIEYEVALKKEIRKVLNTENNLYKQLKEVKFKPKKSKLTKAQLKSWFKSILLNH